MSPWVFLPIVITFQDIFSCFCDFISFIIYAFVSSVTPWLCDDTVLTAAVIFPHFSTNTISDSAKFVQLWSIGFQQQGKVASADFSRLWVLYNGEVCSEREAEQWPVLSSFIKLKDVCVVKRICWTEPGILKRSKKVKKEQKCLVRNVNLLGDQQWCWRGTYTDQA